MTEPLNEVPHCWADFRDAKRGEYDTAKKKLQDAGEPLTLRSAFKELMKGDKPQSSYLYRGCRSATSYRIIRGIPVDIPDVHGRPRVFVRFLDFKATFARSFLPRMVGWFDEYGREVIDAFEMDGTPYIITRLVNP